MDKGTAIVLLALLVFGAVPESGARPVLEQTGEFVVPEANQGVGVDEKHFYAVDNQTIGKYDRLLGPNKMPYGHKANTVMVKFTRDFRPIESWTLPKLLLDKFEDMSNSGGSWGPDGFLYLTGHDPAELYRMRLPKSGSVLELIDIIPMNIRGQGIAWDRSQPGVIYGIIRATAKEKAAGGDHKVTVFKLGEKP